MRNTKETKNDEQRTEDIQKHKRRQRTSSPGYEKRDNLEIESHEPTLGLPAKTTRPNELIVDLYLVKRVMYEASLGSAATLSMRAQRSGCPSTQVEGTPLSFPDLSHSSRLTTSRSPMESWRSYF